MSVIYKLYLRIMHSADAVTNSGVVVGIVTNLSPLSVPAIVFGFEHYPKAYWFKSIQVLTDRELHRNRVFTRSEF